MRACYSCHSTPMGYRMAKFDADLNVEASYIITNHANGTWFCSCPQGHKPTCKHRKLVNEFVLERRINTSFMLDADTKQWFQPVRDQGEPPAWSMFDQASNIDWNKIIPADIDRAVEDALAAAPTIRRRPWL